MAAPLDKHHHRKSLRLPGYDYSQGGTYFITICTHSREYLFGEIQNGEMKLNELGNIVHDIWKSLPQHHPVELDAIQIMPNHVHFILLISSVGRGIARNAPTFGGVTSGSLPCVIRSFKSECSKQIHYLFPNVHIWQRNYHEHIVRDDGDLNRIREYIIDNPVNWENDEMHK